MAFGYVGPFRQRHQSSACWKERGLSWSMRTPAVYNQWAVVKSQPMRPEVSDLKVNSPLCCLDHSFAWRKILRCNWSQQIWSTAFYSQWLKTAWIHHLQLDDPCTNLTGFDQVYPPQDCNTSTQTDLIHIKKNSSTVCFQVLYKPVKNQPLICVSHVEAENISNLKLVIWPRQFTWGNKRNGERLTFFQGDPLLNPSCIIHIAKVNLFKGWSNGVPWLTSFIKKLY